MPGGGAGLFGHDRLDFPPGPLQIGSLLCQQASRQALALPNESQEEVLGANVVVLEQ